MSLGGGGVCELLIFIPSNVVNIYYNRMFVIHCHILRLGNVYFDFTVADIDKIG